MRNLKMMSIDMPGSLAKVRHVGDCDNEPLRTRSPPRNSHITSIPAALVWAPLHSRCGSQNLGLVNDPKNCGT
jgi:hypothetical protein